MVHGIAPEELVRLTPKLKPYLRRPNATWPDIIDAADWLRHDLGVSKSLWGDACLAMGRELAAVALAIISTKEAGHFRTSPGGYFHGMVAKAKAGELHLERTVWAMRRASSRTTSGAGAGPGIAVNRAGAGEDCRSWPSFRRPRRRTEDPGQDPPADQRPRSAELSPRH
jgi:hypothetical protein